MNAEAVRETCSCAAHCGVSKQLMLRVVLLTEQANGANYAPGCGRLVQTGCIKLEQPR